MTTESILLRLYELLAGVEAMRNPLGRAEAANTVAQHLRRAEAQACSVRDAALRQDRQVNPGHTVAGVADATGIGKQTIVNARRRARPVSYRGVRR